MPQLTERDRGLLQNQINDLQSSNQQLQDGIVSDTNQLNTLTLTDIVSKKFLDEKHAYIYALEEERRLLSGKTIIAPVQEAAFWITTPEQNVSVTVNDGRFVAKKNDITFVDVPIIPSRAYNVSKSVGLDFEIWTRDRHGSTTSEKNVPSSYTIHSGNNKLVIIIDGNTADVKIFEDILVDQQSIVIDAMVLSAKIKEGLELVGFTNAQCFYNSSIATFTIASGTMGPTSTAEVVTSTNLTDLSNLMKFTNNQVMVAGKYANNKLNVKIDGQTQQIQLITDIRKATQSSLGLAIDDYSVDWRQDFSDGPMFPAQPNNGPKIAITIQNKLREVGSGGFTTAECVYYTNSQKFVIYSGTFGHTSSVEILPADDINRDLRPFIGMDAPTDVKNNETSYETLQDLYNYLNQKTCLQCTNLLNPIYKCYSLLSINNIAISNRQLILQTTSEYYAAHNSLPKLYGNKLRVDNTNDKFDLNEGSGVITVTLVHGNYAESELAEALQDLLNIGSNVYTILYKKSTFKITATSNFTPLFNSGPNKSRNISVCMGFANFVDPPAGKTFTSNIVSFSGPDFFSMASIPQLVPMSYFNNQPPYYYVSVTEQAMTMNELIYLQTEDNSGTGLINLIKAQNDIYNEANIIAWENVATEELIIVNELIENVQLQITAYSSVSMTDANYNNLVNELNSLTVNKNSLIQYLSSHDYLLNLRISSASYIFGAVFTEGGTEQLQVLFLAPNNDRIYNLPAIEFRYADNKYIPMNNASLIYSNNVLFELFIQTAFSIKSNVTNAFGHAIIDTKLTITDTYISSVVYWSGGDAEHFHYDFSTYPTIKQIFDVIVNDYPTDYTTTLGLAMLWSKKPETFLINNGEQFQIKVATGPTQTITFSVFPAILSSGASPSIAAIVGDTLTLSINGEPAITIAFPMSTNSGTETAAMLQSLVRASIAASVNNQLGYSNFTCAYSGVYTLMCGTSGVGSSINVLGGTLSTKLVLTGSVSGSGAVSNNTAITTATMVSLLSSFTGVTVSSDNLFLKFTANNAGDKIEIISNTLTNRVGFSSGNLISDPVTELASVNCTSMQNVSNQSIQLAPFNVLRGYENRGNITANFTITDNVRLNARLNDVVIRESSITTRLSQMTSRIPAIESLLTATIYTDRWNEVIKRLNKKTGSYYKVGEKEQNIINEQNMITENNTKIAELQAMLGV